MPKVDIALAQRAPRAPQAQPSDFGGQDVAGGAIGQAVSGVAQVTEALFRADVTQRETNAVANAGVREVELRQQIDQEPDFRQHEQLYQEGMTKILEDERSTIGFGASEARFNERMSQVQLRGQQTVNHGVRAKTIDNINAGVNDSERKFADLSIQAADPAAREGYRGQFVESLDSAVASGAMKETERGNRLRRFDENVIKADIRIAIRDDAAGAVRDLREGKRWPNLSEAERGVQTERAIRGYEHDLREDEAQRKRLEAAQDDLEDAELDEAIKVADELLLRGAEGLDELTAHLALNRDILPPLELRRIRSRVALGGGLGVSQSNAGVYADFYDLATTGLDPESLEVNPRQLKIDLREALNDDLLSQPDYDKLLAASVDRRFGQAERFLVDSLKVADSAVKAFPQRAKGAAARQAFLDWAQAHPNATQLDSMEQARQLVSDAAIIELDKFESALLKPSYAVFREEGKRVDIGPTVQATQDAFDNGEIDAFEFGEQNMRIKRIEAAQDAAQ